MFYHQYKSIILSSVLFFVSASAVADTCNDPLRQQEVCREMRHLRSQVLVLGAERDLMQINYNLLEKIGEEVKAGSARALKSLKVNDINHSAGLIGVQAIAIDLIEQSQQKKAEALVTANKIQQQCASCHNSTAPSSGYKWDDIFKSDWSVIYKKCNSAERNPYLCKSMHGMFSYYSGFFTSHQLGLQNFELTELEAKRVASIATDLKNNNLVHGVEEFLGSIVTDASEVAQLASEKNPETFGRALALTQTCMKCHADRVPLRAFSTFSLKPLSR